MYIMSLYVHRVFPRHCKYVYTKGETFCTYHLSIYIESKYINIKGETVCTYSLPVYIESVFIPLFFI